MKKANDTLQNFVGTDYYYEVGPGYVCTDGVMQMAKDYKCFWLIDAIVSYQGDLQRKGQTFQVWKLTVFDSNENKTGAILVCEDGNGHELAKQVIEFTDIEADEAEIWVEGEVLLLPSEH